MLQQEPEIRLLGEVANFAQIFQMAGDLKPSVILMDLHMPDEREFSPDFIKSQLQHSARRVVAMSIWNDEESKALAESYGVVTLLDKANLMAELVPAILRCADV